MKFDLETFVNQLIPALKSNFSSSISTINAQKNDDVVLEDLNDGAWFFESLDDASHNFANFVFVEIDGVQVKENGPRSAKSYSFHIIFFLSDDSSNTVQTQMLRYWRAIEEATSAAWDRIGKGYDKATIQSLSPVSLTNVNTSQKYKIFGSSLNFTIT